MTRSYKYKEHLLIGNYSLVERLMVILYNNIEGKYVVISHLSRLSISCACLSKTLLRRELIHISAFTSPYELRQTQNMNSTLCHRGVIEHRIFMASIKF